MNLYRKAFFFLLVIVAIALPLWPASTQTGLLKVSTTDGSVGFNGVKEIRVPPGTLTITSQSGGYVIATITTTAAPGAGTVRSVGLSLPAMFTVSGSPVTGSGTLTAVLASQSSNLIFASPNGSSGAPAFRAMVAGDVPALDAAKITSGTFAAARLPAMVASGASHAPGIVPDPPSSSGTTKFLREDASWAVPPGLVTSIFGRTGDVTAGTNDYTWAQINKTTSSLADITTRSAGDLSSGTLPDARFPATLPAASGVNLTALNGSNISSGTVAAARLPATLVYTGQANTFGGGFVQTFQGGANHIIVDPTDTTKKFQFDLSNIATGTMRTVNVPNANSTMAQAISAVSHYFLISMSGQGLFSAAQPDVSDITGAAGLASPVFTGNPNAPNQSAGDNDASIANTAFVTAAVAAAANSTSESVLASVFTLNASAGTFQDTGVSVSLPASGTYLIGANVRVSSNMATGSVGYIQCKFYNSTDSADVTNSLKLLFLLDQTGKRFDVTTGMQTVYSPAAAKTIKLYCDRAGATTWTLSNIDSDSNGWTTMTYLKVSP